MAITLMLLFATGLLASTIDAIAGGGGLISLPVLLSMGIPPHVAFGTNKLQGTIGTLIAARRYHKHGLISTDKIYKGIFAGLVGSILGAIVAQSLSSDALKFLIPFLLLIILTYILISPKFGAIDARPRMSEGGFYIIFGFALGFYDGFFGPATGSFWVFALAFFLGFNLIKATATAKLFNLNSSLIATICFMVGGNVDYKIAICMAAGQIIGARLGTHLAIKKGAKLIRPLFLLMVTFTITTMVYRNYSLSVMHMVHQHAIIPQVILSVFVLSSLIAIYLRKMRREI